MKLKEWALVGEIAGAVGIIISLVFVGYQIKQGTEETSLNTRAVEASAYQDLTAQILSLNLSLIENPAITETMIKQACNDEQLTPVETQTLAQISIYALRHGDMAFYMYEQGLIDEARLRTALAIVISFLRSNPITRDLLTVSQDVYGAGFVAYVEGILEELGEARICLADLVTDPGQ